MPFWYSIVCKESSTDFKVVQRPYISKLQVGWDFKDQEQSFGVVILILVATYLEISENA